MYVTESFVNSFIKLWNTRNYTIANFSQLASESDGAVGLVQQLDVFWRSGSKGEPEERR